MQVLISIRRTPLLPWQAAFPDGVVVAGPRRSPVERASSLWLDFSGLKRGEQQLWLAQGLDSGKPVVVLSPTPDDNQAISVFQQGVRGYCHCLSAPERFHQVAAVIEAGGLWAGTDFMQRLLGLIPPARDTLAELEIAGLTEREQAVAAIVASGASNQQIAAQLQITERTVKAHISSIFRKLDVKDRLQLALLLNSQPVLPA